VVHGFIKPGRSARRSTTKIKNVKGNPLDLISAVGLHVDDSERSSRAVGMASGGALAPRTPLAAVV
jgi:hypothetical protein